MADVHLDPDRLPVHARRIGAVLDGLVPLPDLDVDVVEVLRSTVAGRSVVAELERITAALGRAGRELADLAAALDAAAASSSVADDTNRLLFLRLDQELS